MFAVPTFLIQKHHRGEGGGLALHAQSNGYYSEKPAPIAVEKGLVPQAFPVQWAAFLVLTFVLFFSMISKIACLLINDTDLKFL